MSKELDEAWTTICHYNDEIIHDLGSEYVENPLKEEINIVNNALLELKAIKKAKPNEALDLFNHWKDNIEYGVVYIPYFVINEVDQALLKAQEQEKVLDILKSKKYIPLDRLNPRFWNDKETYDETVNYEYYLWLCENECEYVVKKERKLTQEEFDSIMEMLKCN